MSSSPAVATSAPVRYRLADGGSPLFRRIVWTAIGLYAGLRFASCLLPTGSFEDFFVALAALFVTPILGWTVAAIPDPKPSSGALLAGWVFRGLIFGAAFGLLVYPRLVPREVMFPDSFWKNDAPARASGRGFVLFTPIGLVVGSLAGLTAWARRSPAGGL